MKLRIISHIVVCCSSTPRDDCGDSSFPLPTAVGLLDSSCISVDSGRGSDKFLVGDDGDLRLLVEVEAREDIDAAGVTTRVSGASVALAPFP